MKRWAYCIAVPTVRYYDDADLWEFLFWEAEELMSEEQMVKLKLLSRCTFQPGSWPKRFVRDMSSKPDDYEPSVHQAFQIDKLYYKYRRQIGAMWDVKDKPAFEDPGMSPKELLAELDKLDAQNE